MSLHLVMLLVLVKCECGGTGNTFIDMPFEAKQHLIAYSTEKRGEDRVIIILTHLINVFRYFDNIKACDNSLCSFCRMSL